MDTANITGAVASGIGKLSGNAEGLAHAEPIARLRVNNLDIKIDLLGGISSVVGDSAAANLVSTVDIYPPDGICTAVAVD